MCQQITNIYQMTSYLQCLIIEIICAYMIEKNIIGRFYLKV